MKLLFSACCYLTLLLISSNVTNALPILALTDSNKLLRVDSASPGTVLSQTIVTGLQANEILLAIDFRPANGKLYGVTNASRLYVINPTTGAATQVGSGTFTPALNIGPIQGWAIDLGFDFNPVADLIRVVTITGQNLRINPDTGSVVAVDTSLAFAAGDPNAGRAAAVSAAAYTNNFSGATSTTLYTITNGNGSGPDSTVLATQGSPGGTPVSPNTGQLFTVGNVGIVYIQPTGLDVAPDGTAYALLNSTDTLNQFFTINLTTGANSHLGGLGGAFGLLRDLAVPLPNSEPLKGTFQFSASSYSVDESGISVTVTVTRNGDTSGPATVNLRTVDNTATQKSDFIIAIRKLEFAAGETSKSVKILIVDDAFIDPSETFDVLLSNATGGFAPSGTNPVPVSIVDNEVGGPTALPPPNPLEQAEFFVRQHYFDFLNREPDPVGFAFWVNQIDACGNNQQCLELKRINVSAAFFLSIEFQKTGVTAYLTHRVAQFDFQPAYTRFMGDLQSLQKDFVFGAPGADEQLEANTQAFFNDVVSRDEFVVRFGSLSNELYVDTLITNTSVPFTPTERNFLVNGLNNQTETRATVLRRIVANPAFKKEEFNRAFVLMEYFGYLRRQEDFNGFNFWLNKLNSFNGDFIKAEMVKAFISSSEYRTRFGTP